MISISDRFNIFISRLMIRLIRRGYGASCTTKDIEDFPGIEERARCPSCQAREVVDWLEDHVKLINGEF